MRSSLTVSLTEYAYRIPGRDRASLERLPCWRRGYVTEFVARPPMMAA